MNSTSVSLFRKGNQVNSQRLMIFSLKASTETQDNKKQAGEGSWGKRDVQNKERTFIILFIPIKKQNKVCKWKEYSLTKCYNITKLLTIFFKQKNAKLKNPSVMHVGGSIMFAGKVTDDLQKIGAIMRKEVYLLRYPGKHNVKQFIHKFTQWNNTLRHFEIALFCCRCSF